MAPVLPLTLVNVQMDGAELIVAIQLVPKLAITMGIALSPTHVLVKEDGLAMIAVNQFVHKIV